MSHNNRALMFNVAVVLNCSAKPRPNKTKKRWTAGNRNTKFAMTSCRYLVAYKHVDGMQGKREIIQQSGGHSARTRLTSPGHAHAPTGRRRGRGPQQAPTSRGRTRRGHRKMQRRASAKAAGAEEAEAESFLRRRREVRGGRRWRGVAWTGSSVDRMGRRIQPKRAWGPRREPAMMIGAWAFRDPACACPR